MLKFALLYMTDSSMLIYVYEWLHICAECVCLQGFPPASSDMLHWIFSDLSLGVHTLYMHVHCTKPPSVFVPHVYVINVQIKLIGEGTTWTFFRCLWFTAPYSGQSHRGAESTGKSNKSKQNVCAKGRDASAQIGYKRQEGWGGCCFPFLPPCPIWTGETILHTSFRHWLASPGSVTP